jgi:hypothetical protein
MVLSFEVQKSIEFNSSYSHVWYDIGTLVDGFDLAAN